VNSPCFVRLAILLTLISASGAYADGTYQRTEDRKKTLVWNNDPQPGDAATWSGGRDADGYATGPGTLQWFRMERGFMTGSNIAGPKRTPIGSYSGTMVHGKFNGGVTTVDHGKTYHATFADGQKKGRWLAGPLVAEAESVETPVVKKAERAAPETSTEVAIPPKVSEEKPPAQVAKETENVPAEGPGEVSGQKSEISKSTAAKENAERPIAEKATKEPSEKTENASQPLIAQTSTEQPDQSTTSRESVTKRSALAPGAVRAIDRPSGTAAKKSEPEPAKPEKTEKPSKIAKPSPIQTPTADTRLSEDIPAEGPPAPTKEENAQRPTPNLQPPVTQSSPPSAKETPVDNSIRTLTGPPSSLHVSAPPETNPPMQISTPATAAVSSPPPTGPKLTPVNAMDIADIEARTKGYDLGEYQLPKAEYNAASDTWSVAYIARDAEKESKKLNVTIQDKTGKAEVKK
jgi:hypothetical protein